MYFLGRFTSYLFIKKNFDKKNYFGFEIISQYIVYKLLK